jgi:hypothetical protein
MSDGAISAQRQGLGKIAQVRPATGSEFAQLGRGFELWNRIELLESACKRVGQTPHRTGENSSYCGSK